MKIAVTYENGEVGQHFGRTQQFKICQKEGENIQSEIMYTNGSGHGELVGLLKDAGVEVLICGGIGMGARNALAEAGIETYPGVTGNADSAAEAYFAGNLKFDPDTECHHHDHEHGEGHECHHGHEHGEGHGCHGGDCGDKD